MKKLDKITTPESYQWLQDWIKNRYPGNPYPPEPKDFFYMNKRHRQYLSKYIESVMMQVLRHEGCNPEKPKDTGRYIDKSKVVTNVLGQKRKIGTGEWTKDNNVHKGTADVRCFYNGSMNNYEVKVGKDRMSEHQKHERLRAIQNGEKFYIIKTIQDFIDTL